MLLNLSFWVRTPPVSVFLLLVATYPMRWCFSSCIYSSWSPAFILRTVIWWIIHPIVWRLHLRCSFSFSMLILFFWWALVKPWIVMLTGECMCGDNNPGDIFHLRSAYVLERRVGISPGRPNFCDFSFSFILTFCSYVHFYHDLPLDFVNSDLNISQVNLVHDCCLVVTYSYFSCSFFFYLFFN